MPPRLALLNMVDRASVNAELTPDNRIALGHGANFQNIFNRQYGSSIALTDATRSYAPPLFIHVVVIVGLRTKKQMIWIAATRHVAAMQHTKPCGDISTIELP